MCLRFKSLVVAVLPSIILLSIIVVPARSEPSQLAIWSARQAPAFYRLRLGDFRISVLSDGTASRDLPNIMTKPEEVRAAFKASHEALPVELSINCFLVDTGVVKILVDTGAGALFGEASGQLVANMRAAGYSPDDIEVVLLTHIHGDFL